MEAPAGEEVAKFLSWDGDDLRDAGAAENPAKDIAGIPGAP